MNIAWPDPVPPARNHVVRVSPDGVALVLARPGAGHLSSGPRLRGRCEGRNTSGPALTGGPAVPRCRGTRHAAEAVMAKDHDFKRLVRERMQDTGGRCTQARAALIAQRD